MTLYAFKANQMLMIMIHVNGDGQWSGLLLIHNSVFIYVLL